MSKNTEAKAAESASRPTSAEDAMRNQCEHGVSLNRICWRCED